MASKSWLLLVALVSAAGQSESRISPDGARTVRVLPDGDGAAIVFLDRAGKEIRRWREPEMATPLDVEWIDDGRVGVECDGGPSGSFYYVADVETGRILTKFSGLYFTWPPDRRTLAHVGWIPHFAPPPLQNYCLLFNDRAVYTPGCSATVRITPGQHQVKNIHEIYWPIQWSPRGDKLALVEALYDFEWDRNGEPGPTGNYRYSLTIVSAKDAAVSYRLEAQAIPVDLNLEWLDDSHVRVRAKTNSQPWHQTFDLAPR